MGQGRSSCCMAEKDDKSPALLVCCPKVAGQPLEDVDVRANAAQKAFGTPRLYDIMTDKVLLDDLDTEDISTADTVLGAISPAGRLTGSEDSATVDFGGSWLCVRVTGDVSTFMKDVGLGTRMREAAKAASYGAGRQVQNIAQVGDAIVVQNILKEPVTMRFRVGAGPQSTLDQDGKMVHIDPSWDGDALCVESRREDGTLIAHSRRYMSGDTMVLELASPNGARVRRIFEKR